MKYQIDQSIRIEQTNLNTVIGLASKHNSKTLLIPARIKRKFQEEFRQTGQPKKYVIILFSASIALLLQKSRLKIHDLVIDIEYPGHEQTIIQCIKNIYPKINLYFSLVGKKSPAHFAAYGVHIKRKKPNYIAKTIELRKIIKKMAESPKRTWNMLHLLTSSGIRISLGYQ